MNVQKPGTFTKGFAVNFVKILISGIASAVVARLIYSAVSGLGTGSVWVFARLCISAVPALLCYIILSVVLKTDEVKQIRGLTYEK
jgi:hypothetical protein